MSTVDTLKTIIERNFEVDSSCWGKCRKLKYVYARCAAAIILRSFGCMTYDECARAVGLKGHKGTVMYSLEHDRLMLQEPLYRKRYNTALAEFKEATGIA